MSADGDHHSLIKRSPGSKDESVWQLGLCHFRVGTRVLGLPRSVQSHSTKSTYTVNHRRAEIKWFLCAKINLKKKSVIILGSCGVFSGLLCGTSSPGSQLFLYSKRGLRKAAPSAAHTYAASAPRSVHRVEMPSRLEFPKYTCCSPQGSLWTANVCSWQQRWQSLGFS